jgi:hypothetical protein
MNAVAAVILADSRNACKAGLWIEEDFFTLSVINGKPDFH